MTQPKHLYRVTKQVGPEVKAVHSLRCECRKDRDDTSFPDEVFICL